MQKTAIHWTDYSTNPLKYRRKADGKTVWACVKTSPGCAHCYSEAIALRFERGKLFTARNMEEVEPFLDEKELHRMLTYKPAAGKKCFVGDMTDVFGAWVPDELLDRLFAVFALRRDVTWQLLTKRAERLAAYMTTRSKSARYWKDAARSLGYALEFEGISLVPFPLPNVWLGVSVEDQQRADERIPHLLRAPAAVRWLSCEPLLGAVDLWRYLQEDMPWPPVSWCVIGGESGHGARPCDLAWIRSLVEQCRAASVPVFVKQMGSNSTCEGVCEGREWAGPDVYPIHFKDPKGGTPSQWPEPFPREFPVAPAQGA